MGRSSSKEETPTAVSTAGAPAVAPQAESDKGANGDAEQAGSASTPTQPEPPSAPADPPAPVAPVGAPSPAVRSSAPPAEPTRLRVVCSRPNAATVISGVAFATVTIGDNRVHVSEQIEREVAERFCRIPGYTIFDGDEARHARMIEDTLLRQRREDPQTREAADDNAQREIDDLQRANRKLSAELVEARRLNAAQAEELQRLRIEIEGLRAHGARP